MHIAASAATMFELQGPSNGHRALGQTLVQGRKQWNWYE